MDLPTGAGRLGSVRFRKLDIVRCAERLMGMDEAAWQRHANPWSVYSRFTVLPLLSLAICSRVWLGPWALLPVAVVLLWVWLNPRLFPAPASTDNWASQATLGERVYLARRSRGLPAHHLRAARLLQGLSACGLPVWAYGLVSLNGWALILGVAWIMVFKAWFADRMVWLYRDTRDG